MYFSDTLHWSTQQRHDLHVPVLTALAESPLELSVHQSHHLTAVYISHERSLCVPVVVVHRQ